jgi:predicted Zn-dependent protease
MGEKRTARTHGVDLAFDNKRAKVDVIAQWPAKEREIDQIVATGRARQRVHGDVEDIGVRKVGEGQEKDVKLGQDAINQMKMYKLYPPELEDKEINGYIRRLADTSAVNSDLKLPVKVTVLESNEINAFALPGGFLFINTGLVEKVDNESELVGVMAHELSHVAARHGARLMKRATIAGIVFQAAQIAAVVFTGGVAGVGAYYALQYGFFGVGMLIDLALLGVNREFEAEADQLGVQYAWKAGYDPRGFITLFDKLASEGGYVKSASFFRTHPPFFDRILSTFSEIEYLPKTRELQVDSTEFQIMKEKLKRVTQENKELRKKQKSLRQTPQCEDEPDSIEKKPLAANIESRR